MNTSALLCWSLMLLALATAPAVAWDTYDAARGDRTPPPSPGDYSAPAAPANNRFRPNDSGDTAVPAWRRMDSERRWQTQPWPDDSTPGRPAHAGPSPNATRDQPPQGHGWYTGPDLDQRPPGAWAGTDYWPDTSHDPGAYGGNDTRANRPAREPVYRFRADPKLDALSGGSSDEASGWHYRPLTAREAARQRQDGPPQYRQQDLQPRGPWRSYEDHGTAFGYHPDDHGDSELAPYELR
ncbi:MAG: hypothetical protein EA400_13430 [Chromatiaceae bacterium]|nr:MAG: hypothetical protein EA400_13430 [Chromatiaceae bacterium]